LRVATGRAADVLSGYMGRSGEDVRRELDLIVERIQQVAKGDTDALLSAAKAPQAFTRRLVDTLRSEFLAQLRTDGGRTEGKAMLAVLTAMEQIVSANDRPNSRDFTERLSSSDGLNAVLEIAHDMRSPLTSILFLVETVRRGHGPVTPVQDRQLGLIYGAA